MSDFIRRFIDILVSIIALIILLPLFIVIGVVVYFSSPGGVLYCSRRIGQFEKPFTLYKFRSMVSGADKIGSLSVAHTDTRVTTIGRFLRTSKLDEFPQFFNVLIGDMSLVGPRPDIPILMDKVTKSDKEIILAVRPGLADWGSLFTFLQYKSFAKVENIDEFQLYYIQPVRLELQKYYCQHRTLLMDWQIILYTALRILRINLAFPKEVQHLIEQHGNPLDL
jgi:lipopolysaccharide/colanic/teichoic acid biosynthesis glycosyltransferase